MNFTLGQNDKKINIMTIENYRDFYKKVRFKL